MLTTAGLGLSLVFIGAAFGKAVLYGTVPELAAAKQIEQAFAIFYTGIPGSSALAPVLYWRLGDSAGPVWSTAANAVTALAVVPLMLVVSPRLTRSAIG